MDTLFFASALLGGAVLLVQLVLGLFGLDHHDVPDLGLDADVDVGGADAFHLLSIRSLAAGLAFFGVGGAAASVAGLWAPLALVVAAVTGTLAAAGVAALMRGMMRLQSDGTVHLERSIGQPGTVYLSIPGEMVGMGKVHLALQGRTVECQAVSREPLATGTPVVVVDVLGPDTVEVAPSPDLGGLLDASL